MPTTLEIGSGQNLTPRTNSYVSLSGGAPGAYARACCFLGYTLLDGGSEAEPGLKPGTQIQDVAPQAAS